VSDFYQLVKLYLKTDILTIIFLLKALFPLFSVNGTTILLVVTQRQPNNKNQPLGAIRGSPPLTHI
jgi:hypothetical protein